MQSFIIHAEILCHHRCTVAKIFKVTAVIAQRDLKRFMKNLGTRNLKQFVFYKHVSLLIIVSYLLSSS